MVLKRALQQASSGSTISSTGKQPRSGHPTADRHATEKAHGKRGPPQSRPPPSHVHKPTQKEKKGAGKAPNQAQTPTPTQKNRGSNLLSHPTTGQYHQRKKTSRPGSKTDRV